MAQHPGGLYFNRRHLTDGLNMKVILQKLVPDLIVLRQYDNLDNNIRLLL